MTKHLNRHQAPWLTPEASIRERVLARTRTDLAARLSSVLGVSLLALSAVLRGSLTVIPLLVLLAALLLGPRIVAQSQRPEKTHFVLVLCVLTGLAAGAGMTGGASSPLAYLLVVGVVFTALRGAPRATAAGAVVGVTVLLATTLIAAREATLDEPLPLLALLTTVAAVGLGVTGLAGAEARYRRAAILDPLTGLLNRHALETRFHELRRQAMVSSSSICFVLFDLDHFKQVNDLHGHDVGDQLLRGIGEELRMRKFELACRLGGEEFLVVLPGLSEDDGEAAARRLRDMVSRSQVGDGIGVTASFGVSAGAGEDIEFHGLYRCADRALYAAKRNGRDRVAAGGQLLGVATLN